MFFFIQRRHYEGNLTNIDIVAMRVNSQQKTADTLDMFDKEYLFSYVSFFFSFADYGYF